MIHQFRVKLGSIRRFLKLTKLNIHGGLTRNNAIRGYFVYPFMERGRKLLQARALITSLDRAGFDQSADTNNSIFNFCAEMYLFPERVTNVIIIIYNDELNGIVVKRIAIKEHVYRTNKMKVLIIIIIMKSTKVQTLGVIRVQLYSSIIIKLTPIGSSNVDRHIDRVSVAA